MAYSANQNIGGLETLDNTTVANGDLAVVGDVSDSNRAKGITWTSIKAFLKTYFDTIYTNGSGTTDEIAYFVDSDTVGSLTTATYPSKTELSYVKGVSSALQTQLGTKAPLASPTFTGTVTTPAIILSSETASTIASFDASKNVKSLATATYPSLTELSYVKGVTSAIQTQLNALTLGNVNVTGYTAVTVTNTTSETDLISYAVAGGTLSTNKAIKLRMAMSAGWTTNGSSLTVRVKYGATTLATFIYDPTAATTQTGYMIIEGMIIGAGATNAQESNFTAFSNGMTDPATLANNVRLETATAAEDSTASKNLVVSVQWQNSSTDLTTSLLHYLIEKLS